MLNADTKRKIQSARDILVGKIPDPKSQIDQITLALMYKFMDDMDKEAIALGGKARFFSGKYKEYAWSKVLDSRLGAQDRLNLYAEALEKMDDNPNIPQLFRNIFKNAFLPYRDPETLSLFLKQINEFDYQHHEQLGDAFEFLLSVMASQGDAGQFRTPRHIIDFIVAVVDPGKHDSVLDPACGTAGFIISAYKHVLSKYKELNPDERGFIAKNYVGYDISPDMVRLSLVNMYLHGFADPQIYEYDSLSNTTHWDDKYDVILANPPFMSPKGGIKPHNRFSIQANRSEVLFVDYILEHLTTRGKAGIIVPEGIIFQSANAYKQLRKKLVQDGLYAVVSLPAGVFQPYSGVKTSILLFDTEVAKRVKHLLFVKITNDGFDLGAQRRPTTYNDLPLALEALTRYKKHSKANGTYSIGGWPEGEYSIDTYPNCHFVSRKEIIESTDQSLSFERYFYGKEEVTSQWPTITLRNICSFEYGKSLPERDRIEGPYPVMGSNGRSGFHNNFIVNGPAIIIGRKGSAGEVVWEQENCFPIDTTYYVKLINRDEVDLRYLYYILLSNNLKKFKGGAGIPGLNRNDIYKLKIPLPPLEVQKQIVEELDGYQKVIDGAKQIIKSWKPNIQNDYTWEKVELGEVCSIERGASPRPIDKYITKDPDGKNWIKIGDTKNSTKYITETSEKITSEGAKYSRKVSIGDFILSNSMSFGRAYILKIDGYIHDGWLRLTEDSSRIDKDFMYYLLSSDHVMKQFERAATGGVVRNLNSNLVRDIEIFLPSLDTQKQIVNQIEEEKKLIDTNKKLIEIYEQKIKEKIASLWE